VLTRLCGPSAPEPIENAYFFRCHYPALFSVKFRQLGLCRPVLKTVRAKAHAGSNPAPSANKETSFVYGAREVSSCILGKKGQNTVKSGFGVVDRLLWSPVFCVQAPKTAENTGVLLFFLCSAKKEQKCLRGRT
ncbi:MAG: hypothetical protein IK149_02900, partial [Oscillospiraceae bacterium]|nr:hypothetical protein [Oscillospiraceae bacterium]